MNEQDFGVPPFPSEDVLPGEKLYRVRHNLYIQFSGEGPMPPELTAYAKANGGELPSYMPLPGEPVEFKLGDLEGRSRIVAWSGEGALDAAVIAYVNRNGVLPPYTRESRLDLD